MHITLCLLKMSWFRMRRWRHV